MGRSLSRGAAGVAATLGALALGPGAPAASLDCAGSRTVAAVSADWTVGTAAVLDATGSTPGATYAWRFGDGAGGSGLRVEHRYPNPGVYRAELTVERGGCRPTLARTIVVDPPAVWAPVVYLHPNEAIRPGDPARFVARSRLLWDRPDVDSPSCRDLLLAAFGRVDVERLGTAGAQPYSARTSRVVSDASSRRCERTSRLAYADGAPSNVRKSSDRGEGFLLDLPDALRLAATAQPPVLFQYEPGRYLVYWFFYSFNDWRRGPLTIRHEGDWEHVAVRLDADDRATEIAYYQHDCGPEVYRWGAPGFAVEEETHPVVYAARGGHASFPKRGSLLFGCFAAPGFDSAGRGLRWPAAGRLVDARAQPWFGFGGAWGDNPGGVLSAYGPPGPGPGRQNTAPAGW